MSEASGEVSFKTAFVLEIRPSTALATFKLHYLCILACLAFAL